ncbi:hypothetical protein KUTeg_011966, partial [Tegillarca granosa]
MSLEVEEEQEEEEEKENAILDLKPDINRNNIQEVAYCKVDFDWINSTGYGRKFDMAGAVEDVYWYGQTLFLTGQYHRASRLLRSRKLDKTHTPSRYLAAKCHFECEEYQEALNILDMVDNNTPHPFNQSFNESLSINSKDIYEAMDNRNLAVECFREALRQDVYCFEAFDLLVNHHMLSAQEEFKVPDSLSILNENLDVVVNLAERHYYNCDFRECFKVTSNVLSKDPYNTLFYLAHKLVDLYPNKPVSWFAVGCYYLLIGNTNPARRYLSKATTLDRVYGPAWLAFGHAFAADNEHDQAMAAYFTASQLMKGCHLPILYIGLEYGLTNNSKLAERFFSQALSIAPEDPFVLHEMGVIAFQNNEWLSAERYLKEALKKLQDVGEQVMTDKWEPLLNNLGHTCRKLKRYEESLEYHRQARILSPQNPSNYAAIGYVYSLMGNNIMAADYFHKALGIRRDDTFSTTMLSSVIESLMTEMGPYEGASEDLPPFSGQLEICENTPSEEKDLLDESSVDNSSMAIE